jgi:hypothetical protein
MKLNCTVVRQNQTKEEHNQKERKNYQQFQPCIQTNCWLLRKKKTKEKNLNLRK